MRKINKGTWLSAAKVRTWLSLAALLLICGLAGAQNNGLTPTSDRGRLLPAKTLRKSIGTLKLLITDATSEVKYWQKDTAFIALWKINIDSLIRNYNDTVDKSASPCVDSLWKVSNLIYHRDQDCGVQSVSIAPLCTDSVWKVSTTIYHRSITCQIESWPSGEGCSGGDVYYTASLGDTTGLSPVPECGDVLVVTQDTCRKYVYSRGATPVKWNFIGAFLDNENCFDFPVCVDSFWRSGNLIYHRNIDCIVQSVVDSNTAATGRLHKKVGGGHWINRLSDTDVDANREFKTIIAGDNIIIDTTSTTLTITATGDTVLHKNTGVGVGKIVKADNVSSDDNRKFKSILKGDGINVTNLTDEVQITALVDTVDHRNIGTGYEVVAEGTIATSADYNRKFRSIKGDGTVSFAYGGVVQNGYQPEIILGVDTSATIFNKFNYDMANVGSGREVYKNKTGTDPTIFNLRTLLGAGSTKVTQGTNEITIQDTSSSILNTTGLTGGGGIGYFKTTLSPIPTGGSIRLSAGNNIKITETTSGLDGVYSIEALPSTDSIWTATSSATTFNFNHRPDQTSDVTITAGTGIKFDNNATGRNGTFRINADTSSVIFDGIANQLIFANSTGANNANLSLTPQSGTSKVNLVGAGIITTSSSAGTNGTITITGTEVDGDVSNEIQTYTHTGTGGYTNTLSRGGGTFSLIAGTNMTISHSSGSVTLNSTAPAPDPCLIAPAATGAVQNSLIKDEFGCLGALDCGWDFQTAASGQQLFLSGGCIRKCSGDPFNCVQLWQGLDFQEKMPLVADSDMTGLYRNVIAAINDQNARLKALETPQYTASTSAILANNVTQSKLIATINAQAKLIEELTARLDRLDRLQASK